MDLRPGDQPVLRSLPWDLNMMAVLTNGAGGNDHLDLLQLRAGAADLDRPLPSLRVAVFQNGWRPVLR